MSNHDPSLCTCGCCETNSDNSQRELKNLPGLSSLRFRIGTHSSFKKTMLEALSGKPALAGKLTSRSDEDMTIATLDAWATVLDVLSFYQERIINEGYLRTATERLSVLSLAQHISYKLKPGVAASGFLAFSMNEAPGAPAKAIISAGTKIQSIPEQNQLPQVFETAEEIEAKVEWNGIKLQTKKKMIPVFGAKEIYLQGVNTGLQPGDGLLMIGSEREDDAENENWDFRRIKEVITDNELDHTKITWDKGLGIKRHNVTINPAKKNFKVFVFRQRAFLFGYNAPDFRIMSETVKDLFNPDSTSADNKNTDWKDFTIEGVSYPGEAHPAVVDTIHLDGIYSKIINGSWLVIATGEYNEVYKVDEAVESSRRDFTLSTKTMAVKLAGENLKDKFNEHIRDAVIYAQSEELQIAEAPVTGSIKDRNELTLEKLMPGLSEGKTIAISGKLQRLEVTESGKHLLFTVEGNSIATRELVAYDSLIILAQPEIMANGKIKWVLQDSGGFEGSIEAGTKEYILTVSSTADAVVNEIHTIASITTGTDPTVIKLTDLVTNYFDAATVLVNANVAAATHGETRSETLGSGNGSLVFQSFDLKQTPLTYISAATASGTETTLQVSVNDILWEEVPSFYGISPKEKVYTTTISDEGIVTVLFGDGITGARLPTGTSNVKAVYRTGIGADGTLNEGQLSMILAPQLGVSKVTNPIGTSGAADPETLDDARLNAPLTVLTLDRIVSIKDFENFARAFAGIAKARAEMIWSGEKQVVHITVAAEDEGPVDSESELYTNLLAAIKTSGHSYNTVYVDSYTPLSFTITANISVNSSYVFENVQEQVLLALENAFSFDKRDFGQDITASEVIAVIQSVEGVVYTDLELLNDKNPFLPGNSRVTSNTAIRDGDDIEPAQLLTINTEKITLTEILP